MTKYAWETPEYALKNSKTFTTNLKTIKNKSTFTKGSNFFTKCACQKIISRPVK